MRTDPDEQLLPDSLHNIAAVASNNDTIVARLEYSLQLLILFLFFSFALWGVFISFDLTAFLEVFRCLKCPLPIKKKNEVG